MLGNQATSHTEEPDTEEPDTDEPGKVADGGDHAASSTSAASENSSDAGVGTGHREIDAALASLDDLDDDDLGNHHDRLAIAHEALHQALTQARPDQG